MRSYLAFAIAGGTGFVVDAAVLMTLVTFTPLDPFTARMLAIAYALTVTWLINRNFTFERSGRAIASEGARYGGVGLATSCINYAVYCLLLVTIPGIAPLAALAIASLVAMALSYAGYARLVFNRA